MKHWHILQVNQTSGKTFRTLFTIAFRKGTSLKQIFGASTIYSNDFNQNLKKKNKNNHTGDIINFITYLLECYICRIPYVGKSETSFTIRLINQRKDIKNANSILARKSFNRRDHGSNNHRKLTMKEQLRNITTASTEAFFKRKTKAARKLLDNKNLRFWYHRVWTKI